MCLLQPHGRTLGIFTVPAFYRDSLLRVLESLSWKKGNARRNKTRGSEKLAADKDKAELDALLAEGSKLKPKLNSAESKANGIIRAVMTDQAWMWTPKKNHAALRNVQKALNHFFF